MSAASSSRERVVTRSAASRATNAAVILSENGISLRPGTATATARTEYSVGTGLCTGSERSLASIRLETVRHSAVASG
jgi:hypothetical protein